MENARKVKLFGDRIEAMRKYGQGQALLRATKSIAELLGLPYYRLFSSDKQVMAQSIPGIQDQITLFAPEILKPEEEELKPYCSINFINLPTEIPPMKWYAPGLETFTKVDGVWVIKDPNGVVEVEGVDYIKTYYRLNVTDCNECSPFISTVCKTEELYLARCHPYIYDATKLPYQGSPVPYFQGWPDRVPPIPPDPENHLIHSFYESGQAEILKFGSDGQGSYFLWKAYTEWGAYPPTDITFSRTGLGYLLLKAFIQFEGMELCKAETIVKVDCCLKPINDRKVEIWWEDFGTCQPYIMYSGVAYNSICKMPLEVPIGGISGLVWYGCMPPYQPLYSIPEILGNCLPVEWTFTGPITFRGNSKKNDNAIFFQFTSEVECFTEVGIILRDRCGNEYSIRGSPCCEDAGPLSISYTSLLMSCGHSQELTAQGGCPPWSWSLSGGGSLSGSIGKYVTYTAPATNANCLDNPTIILTDCCGNSASVSLAVNCYVTTGVAYGHNERLECEGCWKDPRGIDQGFTRCWDWIIDRWNCDGTVLSHCETKPCGTYSPHCPPNQGNWIQADCDEIPYPYTPCWTNQCGCACQGIEGGCDCTWVDCRTALMKQQGCCPINPVTGLPY